MGSSLLSRPTEFLVGKRTVDQPLGACIRRWINVAPECVCCEQAIEDSLHVLRDCPDIKSLWVSLIKPGWVNRFFGCNIQEWCSMNLRENCGRDGGQWRDLFAVTCWLIWKRRNEKMFEDQTSSVREIHDKAKVILISFNSTKNRLQHVNIRGAQTHSERNSCSRIENGVIVRVDGAFSHNSGSIGCGGTIITPEGTLLESFMLRLPDGDALFAKLWECLIGLKRAWDGGQKSLHV
ncbi:uncharacterized protein LOC114716907 [Neltuma alba]|uniref:uncharacterized protein LOC114716907 n=1 Tax=Neltuma alba TaxID=207710 RepID=UPI0010A30244|nr:uncharacterized protein LOC114716907 [Prosopis alba]